MRNVNRASSETIDMESVSEADRTAACNLIRSGVIANRKLYARSFHRHITHKMYKEGGRQVSISVAISYDPQTGCVYANSSLRYCRHNICPGTHNRKRCINAAGLAALYASRSNQLARSVRLNYKRVSQPIGSGDDGRIVASVLRLYHDSKNGAVNINHVFEYHERHIHLVTNE